MSKRIEEVFNDCFERLLLGESLESCLRRYPEYAAELDSMLRTSFDIKRKSFPVQPRPEFKYWARVRMQNIQYYSTPQVREEKISVSNLRRNLAFSLAALLVLVIASSGTVAASSQAMPDEPLYGVKMAVEQAQITLTPSDVGKAKLYAQLAEKRAQEIAVMADKGKTDQVVATTAKLNYQLDQSDALLAKYEAALAASGALSSPTPATTPTVPTNLPAVPTVTVTPTPTAVPPTSTATSTAVSGNTTAATPPPYVPPATPAVVENATVENATVISVPAQPSTTVVAENATAENATLVSVTPPPAAALTADNTSAGSKRYAAFVQGLKDVNTAQTDIDASTDKSLSILQNALDRAPESAKSSLTAAIERTKRARAHITSLPTPTQTSTQTSDNQTSDQTPTTTDNSTQQQGTYNHNWNKRGR